MQLNLGSENYLDGEKVEYYILKGVSNLHGQQVDLSQPSRDYSNVKRDGRLKYNKAGWMSTAGWILNGWDSNNTYQYDLNKVNILNNNPFNKDKINIQLKKTQQSQPEQPVSTERTLLLGDDEYLNDQKIDYYIENNEERETIRFAGHERAKSEHTYKHRWATILKELGIN
jgi:hypothetical protein